MNLSFQGNEEPYLPTLGDILQPDCDTGKRPEQVTFIFEGYVYALIHGAGVGISFYDSEGRVCMNLKSQTLRVILLTHKVRPVSVNVSVGADMSDTRYAKR